MQWLVIALIAFESWDAPIPLPALAGYQWWMAVTAGGAANTLYVMAWASGTTYIYQWVFD